MRLMRAFRGVILALSILAIAFAISISARFAASREDRPARTGHQPGGTGKDKASGDGGNAQTPARAIDRQDVLSPERDETPIVWLASEGARVKKGDLVCTLDSSRLEDELASEEVALKRAGAASHNAQSAREVAEIRLREYTEGTSKSKLEAIQGGIALARGDLQLAIGPVQAAEEAHRNDETAKRAAHNLDRAKFALERALTKERVFKDYTHPRRLKELAAALERARGDEVLKQAERDRMKAHVDALRKRITQCKILAPADGTVALAPAIRTGTVVAGWQRILSIMTERAE